VVSFVFVLAKSQHYSYIVRLFLYFQFSVGKELVTVRAVDGDNNDKTEIVYSMTESKHSTIINYSGHVK
jgi:hypothetical protein